MIWSIPTIDARDNLLNRNVVTVPAEIVGWE
jgi:hypothetical protein